MRTITIGMDEVGRGALAGPLVVCAVALGEFSLPEVEAVFTTIGASKMQDSKKLTKRRRELLVDLIHQKVIWAIGAAEAPEIDLLGLTAATRLAAGRAFADLQEHGFTIKNILADAGLRHPLEKEVSTEWFVKGDEKIAEIALASSLAKVHRDRLMGEYGATYPGFGFERHVGYGTKAHYAALKEQGVTLLHRKLFLRNFATKNYTSLNLREV